MGPRSVSELSRRAAALGILKVRPRREATGGSGIVDAMARKGWVTKTKQGRYQVANLTKAGREIAGAVSSAPPLVAVNGARHNGLGA